MLQLPCPSVLSTPLYWQSHIDHNLKQSFVPISRAVVLLYCVRMHRRTLGRVHLIHMLQNEHLNFRDWKINVEFKANALCERYLDVEGIVLVGATC